MHLPPTKAPLVGAPVHRRPQGHRCVRVFEGQKVEGALPVIPKICDVCEQQRLEKPASLYWAWTNADGRRRAWKQRVCADCFRDTVMPMIFKAEDPDLICPACGIGTADDYDAVYLSYYLPGMPAGQSEFPCCPSCAVTVRNQALRNARELDDRGASVGGPQPQPVAASETWASLGKLPYGTIVQR